MSGMITGAVAIFGVGLLGILGSGLAKPKARRLTLALMCAWLVPGAGHVVVGRWRKGAFLFGVLTATYVFGLWLSDWRTVALVDQPFYYVGQFGSGITLLLGQFLGAEKAYPTGNPSWFDPGLLYVCVVGLLNVVIMMSLIEVRDASNEKPGAASGVGA